MVSEHMNHARNFLKKAQEYLAAAGDRTPRENPCRTRGPDRSTRSLTVPAESLNAGSRLSPSSWSRGLWRRRRKRALTWPTSTTVASVAKSPAR